MSVAKVAGLFVAKKSSILSARCSLNLSQNLLRVKLLQLFIVHDGVLFLINKLELVAHQQISCRCKACNRSHLKGVWRESRNADSNNTSGKATKLCKVGCVDFHLCCLRQKRAAVCKSKPETAAPFYTGSALAKMATNVDHTLIVPRCKRKLVIGTKHPQHLSVEERTRLPTAAVSHDNYPMVIATLDFFLSPLKGCIEIRSAATNTLEHRAHSSLPLKDAILSNGRIKRSDLERLSLGEIVQAAIKLIVKILPNRSRFVEDHKDLDASISDKPRLNQRLLAIQALDGSCTVTAVAALANPLAKLLLPGNAAVDKLPDALSDRRRHVAPAIRALVRRTGSTAKNVLGQLFRFGIAIAVVATMIVVTPTLQGQLVRLVTIRSVAVTLPRLTFTLTFSFLIGGFIRWLIALALSWLALAFTLSLTQPLFALIKSVPSFALSLLIFVRAEIA